ncbi:MAG TPA: DUF559 domain-containing protein [Candidatus Methanomethylophilaceae archaeon]|nr:DUF559 domain-containing protein [Candidatus Methanomethylophilaceae archaeon]
MDFWTAKFQGNVERDIRNTMELESSGWAVITIWECEIKEDNDAVLDRLLSVLVF